MMNEQSYFHVLILFW